jgi:protein-disulfide isomerase
MKPILWFVAATLLAATPATAGLPPRCEALDGDEKALAQQLLGALKGWGCCAEPLATCLAAENPCPASVRQADDLCRQVMLGRERAEIEEALALRRKSLTGGQAAGFALEDAARAGDPAAPVTAVIYACTRCPYCRDMVLALHREVTEGELAGKVKLYLRPFPLKGHEGATEGGLALMAAQRLGSLWPYATLLFKRYGEFHPAVLADWAEPAGLDRAAFEKALGEPATRAALTESRKGGLRNKVDATPSVFIGGRKYLYELDSAVLVDVLLEEYERTVSKKP